MECLDLLKRRPAQFKAKDILPKEVDDLVCKYVGTTDNRPNGRIVGFAEETFNGKRSSEEFKFKLLKIFHNVGVVGLRIGGGAKISWSFEEFGSVREADIGPETVVAVSPMFYRVLGINTRLN